MRFWQVANVFCLLMLMRCQAQNSNGSQAGNYLDVIIEIQQFQDTASRLACQNENLEGSELFVEPAPCFAQNESFTEDACLEKGCCFFEDEEFDEEASCHKRQSFEFIMGKLQELQLLPADQTNSNRRKQLPNFRLAATNYVQCLALSGVNCLMSLNEALAPVQIQRLIREAVVGDQSARQTLVRFTDLSFATALLAQNVISSADARVIFALYNSPGSPVATPPAPVLPTATPAPTLAPTVRRIPYDNRLFIYHFERQSYDNAITTCAALNANLLTINSAVIDTEVKRHLVNIIGTLPFEGWESYFAPGYWVGGRNRGSWQWNDNSLIPLNGPGYQNWYRQAGFNQPSRSRGTCLYISAILPEPSSTYSGILASWFDTSCFLRKYFICATGVVAANPCTAQPSPCLNGAVCELRSSSPGGFVCNCLAGFIGTRCGRLRDPPPSTTSPPSTCSWYPWGAWSNCQGVCGIGVRSRFRRCQGGCVPGNGGCQGPCTQKRGCANPVGQICAYWSGWSPYEQCTATCGSGVRIRRRSCYGGRVGEIGCTGSNEDSIACSVSGILLPWSNWGDCSLSCGSGSRTRVQTHTCEPDNSQTEACSTQPCCGKLPWGPWLSCSTTCGAGTQKRYRDDLCPTVPREEDVRACNFGNGNWGDWAPWSDCSITCAGGTSYRERSNPCYVQNEREERSCGAVGEWSAWRVTKTCSSSCPGGFLEQSRVHQCTNEVETRNVECGQQADDGPWGQFGSCSRTCRGTRSRERRNPCIVEPQRDFQECGTNDVWNPWSPWSACTQSCIGGTRTRSRLNPCTNTLDAEESEPCGSPGTWGGYSEWSVCTKTCGGGERYRTRLHQCPLTQPQGNGVQQQSENCAIQPCCFHGEWTTWTDCPRTCGYGIRSSERISNCAGVAPIVRNKYCSISSGEWSEWTNWGDCSESCRGTRSRIQIFSCTGEERVELEHCGQAMVYDDWTEWSSCSRPCGGGTQFRTRTNLCGGSIGGSDRTQEFRECNTDPGSYGVPGQWSSCSRTCRGQGMRTRVTLHSCNLPSLVEMDDECGSLGVWENWEQWSGCSFTCVGGMRSRSRRHQCTGAPDTDVENCGSPGAYYEWTQWSACDRSCAGGSRTRTRGHSCRTQIETDRGSCGVTEAYFWTLWGSCSKTCGSGTQMRERVNSCGTDRISESRTCSTSQCCIIMPWEPWSQCSKSCFIGQQQRVRYSSCSRNQEVATEIRDCDAGSGVTSPWSQWSQCQVSCGGGTIFRTSSNTCSPTDQVQRINCNTDACPYWENWEVWSSCTATCGNGEIRRERICRNPSGVNVPCEGSGVDIRDCTVNLGQWNLWTSWTLCTRSCGGGTTTRQRTHTCNLPMQEQTVPCNTSPGFFTLWTQWTTCSKTCGVGTRERQRSHTCTNEVDNQIAECSTPELYNQWSLWSDCPSSCALAARTRTRTHNCGLPDQTQSITCNTDTGSYGQWSLWSQCSRTCAGLRSRRRSHSCGLNDMVEQQNCGQRLCPYWSGWTPYGDCDVTCGSGTRIRTRMCQGGTIGQIGCIGEFRQETTCDAGLSDYSDWSRFGECTKSCGGGSMTRSRTNPCAPLQLDTVACNTDLGSWSPWTQWTACNAQCGGGTRSRNRYHTCTNEMQSQQERCNTDPGTWTEWSTFSDCSHTCGNGFSSRQRRQTCTGERDEQTISCNVNPCAIWDGWSNWGSCSSSCGPGEQSRDRRCQGGQPGEGFCFTSAVGAVDKRSCNAGDCCGFEWSGWSSCCRPVRTPTIPIQLRFEGNQCGQPWKIFNRTCPIGLTITNIACTNLAELFETADNFRENEGFIVNDPARRSRGQEVSP